MFLQKNCGLFRFFLFMFIILPAFLFCHKLYGADFYWEEPRLLVDQNARFLRADTGREISVIAWHEYEQLADEEADLYFSVAVTENGRDWKRYQRVVGPFTQIGDPVPVASLVVDSNDQIFLVCAPTDEGVMIYRSQDKGAAFQRVAIPGGVEGQVSAIAPRLFKNKDRSLVLFASMPMEIAGTDLTDTAIGVRESLGITYAVSDNGILWSRYSSLVQESELTNTYLPHYTEFEGRKYVVFQASPPESRFYQIYLKISEDRGRTWSRSIRLTDFEERFLEGDGEADNYDNQRPFIAALDDRLAVVWERRFVGQTPPQIYYLELDRFGNKLDRTEAVTIANNVCRSPQIIQGEGEPHVIWFDDRRGPNRVFMASRRGTVWEDQETGALPGDNTFTRVIVHDEEVYLLWENTHQNQNRLAFLEPDRFARPPALRAENFSAGRAAGQNRFTVTWNIPEDPSGIAGFSYAYSQDPEVVPPQEMMLTRRDTRRIDVQALQDGKWYVTVRARDFAGNWSEPAVITFYRDTTPPGQVEFSEPEKDEDGFLISNTKTIAWEEPDDEDVAGYSYRFQYLARHTFTGDKEALRVNPPPERIMTTDREFSFRNRDNGLWALSVSAIDHVGNVGEPETLFIRMNKYIPVTYITRVEADTDELGLITLRIIGRGFSEGGEIEQVILDREGREPFDYVFTLDANAYNVETDRIISGPSIDDIEEGSYQVGVIHPTRGLYFTTTRLSLEPTGTVKFGDFTILGEPETVLRRISVFTLSFNRLIIFSVMVFLVGMLLFTSYRMSGVIKEGYMLKMEVRALLESRELPGEKKKKRITVMKKRGVGLRIKFALLVTFLVLIIVLLVSVPLGQFMSETQQRNLTDGLLQSTRVMIESINTSAERDLPEQNRIELGRTPDQISAMEDAQFVTITGVAAEYTEGLDEDYFDYLWATNDPEIQQKIVRESDDEDYYEEGREEAGIRRGEDIIEDEISPKIPALQEKINQEAKEAVGELAAELPRLQREAREAAAQIAATQAEEAVQLLNAIEDEISLVRDEIEDRLRRVSDMLLSEPEFVPEEILMGPTEYIFYRPVVYQDTARPDNYYHGMIRLSVSAERIIEEITLSRESLIRQTALIALGAIGIGIIGALILATIIIRPINRLLRGVEVIRDTEDKEQLKSHVISVKSRDEIASLADAVNQMTQGLVKAAAANKELTVGKEVQKMFIPLDVDSHGNKLSTGKYSGEYADFFGYYEGAKGVSGDYFDFLELGTDRYGIIKCDVAGKGVSASLIMVEVATIFRSYFYDWIKKEQVREERLKTKGIKYQPAEPTLDDLIYNINGMLQERGFKGRFAALIVIYFDAKTGKTVMCNAGDNIVHIFNAEKQKMDTKTLPEAPASGVFPNDLVEMQAGFKKIPHAINKGDILFLFTDGIEEAQRKFRDENFKPITCNEPGLKQGELHDTHPVGNDNEELGIPRIKAILDTFHAKGVYKLYKYHNPSTDDNLEFDFSDTEGSVQEAVLAMVAVEKVFRLCPDPAATEEDKVRVDFVVHAFLEKTFRQYNKYFGNKQKEQEEGAHLTFTHLKEDEQYDDLTVLAVKKIKS